MRKERVAEMFAGKAQIFESVEVQLIMWSGISYRYPGGIVYVLTSAYMSSRSSDGMQRNVEISESAIFIANAKQPECSSAVNCSRHI